jgi:hypothetical protein
MKKCMVTHERGRERVRESIFPRSADTIKKYDWCVFHSSKINLNLTNNGFSLQYDGGSNDQCVFHLSFFSFEIHNLHLYRPNIKIKMKFLRMLRCYWYTSSLAYIINCQFKLQNNVYLVSCPLFGGPFSGSWLLESLLGGLFLYIIRVQ